MSKNRTVITDFRLPGSRERMIGGNGEFNANSKQDLVGVLTAALAVAKGGTNFVSQDEAERASEFAKAHNDMIVAAFSDDQAHADTGILLANQLTVSANKAGFMRNFMKRQDLTQGQIPSVQMQMKNVTAIVASAPSTVEPQNPRDNWLYPSEFYISAQPFIEQRDINRSNTDILEQKYFEALEGIMVAEDRTWLALANQASGVANGGTSVVGNLTTTVLGNVRNLVTRWRVPVSKLLVASDLWTDVLADSSFSVALDPVSKHELFLTGQLGTMLGMEVHTDAYRHQSHQVLGAGEFWVIGDAINHGQYTDRGGVVSEPVTQAMRSVPGRGWFLSESVSMAIANARSVARGQRTA